MNKLMGSGIKLIPDDILIEYIFKYCEISDLSNLKSTNKKWYNFIKKEWLYIIWNYPFRKNSEIKNFKFLQFLYIRSSYEEKILNITHETKYINEFSLKNNFNIEKLIFSHIQKKLNVLTITHVPNLSEIVGMENLSNLNSIYINNIKFLHLKLFKYPNLKNLILLNIDSGNTIEIVNCPKLDFINLSASSYKKIIIRDKLTNWVHLQILNIINFEIHTWKMNMKWLRIHSKIISKLNFLDD